MNVVIQCAGRKRSDAGHLRSLNGQNVLFIANPRLAPVSESVAYAHPDDRSDFGVTWRDLLLQYNRTPDANPSGLARAIDLYANPTYRQIEQQCGAENTFILSAAWGLIGADFLTPNYDLTFKQGVAPHLRRRKADRYSDFCQLPADTDEEIVFLGGKDYLPLFSKLTHHLKAKRSVFYHAGTPPEAPGCNLIRFGATANTNWHYQCAQACLSRGFREVMQEVAS